MEFRNMKTFLRVAELQSFTKAAEELGYSQSTVTVQIKQLEEELDVTLFERIGRKVKLTEQGILFRNHARDILASMEMAMQAMGEAPAARGSLRIGTVDSLCSKRLLEVLLEFRKQCPQVEISVKTEANEFLYDMLQKNEVDIIFFLDEMIYEDDWIKTGEIEEKTYFVGSVSNPLTKKESVSLEEILQQPLILTEKGMSYRKGLEKLVAMRGLELHPVLEMGDTQIIAQLAANDAGVTYLPWFIVEPYIKEGKLAIIPCCEKIEQVWSQLVYHKDKVVTPQMDIFLKILDEVRLRLIEEKKEVRE